MYQTGTIVESFPIFGVRFEEAAGAGELPIRLAVIRYTVKTFLVYKRTTGRDTDELDVYNDRP